MPQYIFAWGLLKAISFCSSFMMNERFRCRVCKITDTPWGLLTSAAFATRRTHRFAICISFRHNRVLGLQSWNWENRQFLLIQNQSGSSFSILEVQNLYLLQNEMVKVYILFDNYLCCILAWKKRLTKYKNDHKNNWKNQLESFLAHFFMILARSRDGYSLFTREGVCIYKVLDINIFYATK